MQTIGAYKHILRTRHECTAHAMLTQIVITVAIKLWSHLRFAPWELAPVTITVCLVVIINLSRSI
jgi:hypothetical protein